VRSERFRLVVDGLWVALWRNGQSNEQYCFALLAMVCTA
jgi:hypothetical protein